MYCNCSHIEVTIEVVRQLNYSYYSCLSGAKEGIIELFLSAHELMTELTTGSTSRINSSESDELLGRLACESYYAGENFTLVKVAGAVCLNRGVKTQSYPWGRWGTARKASGARVCFLM